MAGIESVKIRLGSENVEQRIAALAEALKYGQEGLNLLIQALKDESWQIQHAAFLLLRQRSVRSVPQVKKALRDYIAFDGQYPDERQEIKSFLSNSSWVTEDEYGYRRPLPELLQFMKWGEVLIDDINATGDGLEGIHFYIVDCYQNRKIWKSLSLEEFGELTIPLKFLQKKGYSYYLKDLLFLIGDYLRMNLPVFNGKEILVFKYDVYSEEIIKAIVPNINNFLNKSPQGKLIEEDGNWFIVSEEASKSKLPRLKNFYRIPKKSLAFQGYSYYREMSQAHQLPIIGYLSPKEYLDFLNLQILDFLSLKPTWSNSFN